jgi:hypothetical protein
METLKDKPPAKHEKDHHQGPWWSVMCLTGVDYFSTLGYQPGIAFLAAGILSPIATAILVLLTLCGALPVYYQVAKHSPHGQGSLAMLEELLPKWKGKTLVLILLGFAATDFIITITLSAADAAAHITMNPMLNQVLPFGQLGLTLMLVFLLGAIFIMGFREAIGISFVLVTIYLALNAVVLTVASVDLLHTPIHFTDWSNALFAKHHSAWTMIGISMLLFPKLALGLSGFETGVAVMPLVKADGAGKDEASQLPGRVKNTRKLLFTAAMLMSIFLIISSLTTSLLIPAEEFAEHGSANGRAISYLCHHYLGGIWGTTYDISSILILWFAGASAMAGLLNLVPRYLPRYGMAPEWARAIRPLVIFLTFVAMAVTIIFKANVDAQGGAYATGVLVLITSAALAVALRNWNESILRRVLFVIITLIFAYTTVVNVFERPDGLHIAMFFITAILLTSLISRALRSTELRVKEVELDAVARQFIESDQGGEVRLVAHRPGGPLDKARREACEVHNLTPDRLIFIEVSLGDASEFASDKLLVQGERIGDYRVLKCISPAIPNAIAAILLHIRDKTSCIPHIYMGWTEGNPVAYVIKFIFLGEGETAPVTREILREVEKDPNRRPRVHVG